jgi:hypothetical protein
MPDSKPLDHVKLGKRIILFPAFFLSLTISSRAQQPLSLDDAVRVALARNPAVQASGAAVKGAS